MKQKILEASLSRIYRDYQKNEFSIITAWRVGDKNNKSNLNQLKSAVRSGGFGFVRIDGVGQEEDESGKIRRVKEPSLLVKNVKKGGKPVMDSSKFENFMINLGKRYNQWGIVLHNPKKGTRLISLKPTAKVVQKMSKFNPMKTGQFFSSLKGKSFTFEGFKYGDPPENWIHGMSMEKDGYVDIHKHESTERWMKQIIEITEKL